MLLVVMLFGMAAALLVYGMVDTTSLALRRDKDTAAALAQAKQALIGRAVSDDNRPGSLPCPDAVTDIVGNVPDDGVADLFIGNDCPTYIGRLPWRTLGLPDLRDDAGERLWYALSNNFRDDMSAGPLNSDTQGNRTVYTESSAVTITGQAVAVIFAPGAIVAGQVRDPAISAACAAPPGTIATTLCAANYLEATGGANNATDAGPYITAQRSGTFNDRLLVITTTELMPPVEQRVARELRKILQDYKANTACVCTTPLGLTGCYPWADLSNGESDAPPYQAVGEGRNRGRIPALGAGPYNWGATPCGTGPLAVPTLPSWFVPNDWRLVVYYSAGQNYLGPGICPTCTATTLTVDATSKELVILMPGPLLAASPRAPVSLSDSTYWSYYFEDAANQDFADDIYATPSSTAYTRDRIYTIP
jgi:type II secretory pathway pseudopilin PulG